MQKIQDDALLTAFHLMTPDEQAFFLQTAQVMTRDRPVYKPKLLLITGGALPSRHRILNGSSRNA